MPRKRPLQTVGRPAPVALQTELERALAPMIAQIRASLGSIRRPRDVAKLRAALRREWSDARIRRLVVEIGTRAEIAGSRGWARFERQHARARGDAVRLDATTYDGRRLVERWSRKAVSLITSVRDEVAEGLRRDIVQALAQGIEPEALAARWRRRGIPLLFGTLEGRTKVIAQHQLSSLHAQVQSERARALGVTEFVWRTQGDDRVRDAHRALDGTRHRYDEPPDEGLPGQPVNCRCWAESVIPDALLGGLRIRAAT